MTDDEIHYIDKIIELLQHPFYMMLGGLLFYFFIKWSIMKNLNMIHEFGFWHDQKDEIGVSLIGGLLFVVWDDEAMRAYYHYKSIEFEGEPIAEDWMYFGVGVIIENIYTGASFLIKLKNKFKKIKITVEDGEEN